MARFLIAQLFQRKINFVPLFTVITIIRQTKTVAFIRDSFIHYLVFVSIVFNQLCLFISNNNFNRIDTTPAYSPYIWYVTGWLAAMAIA